MNRNNFKFILLSFGALSLTGCANMSVFKDAAPVEQSNLDPLPLEPVEPLNPTLIPAAEIKRMLVGKSWRWQGPTNGGVTLYAADGTSLVEVSGKGTTQGKWVVKDGQLCESFGKAKFIPNGVPMKCQPFVGMADNYRVGQASFTPEG